MGARGRWQHWPHRELGKREREREREREKDFLSFGSPPFPFLKGIGNSRVAVYRKGKKIYISPSWPPEWYRPSYHPISSGIDLANILDRNYALRTLEMVFQSINGLDLGADRRSPVLSTSSRITSGRRFWTVSPGWVSNLPDSRRSLPFLHVSRYHWTKVTERLINLKLNIYHEKFFLYFKIFRGLWLFVCCKRTWEEKPSILGHKKVLIKLKTSVRKSSSFQEWTTIMLPKLSFICSLTYLV